jgi:hypothetical protein
MSGTQKKQPGCTRTCTRATCHRPSRDIKELLENAKSIRAKARIDKKALKEKEPTHEEERLWIEQQIAAAFEQWEKGLNDGSDDEDDGSLIEEEGPDVKEEPVVREEPVEE